jgi:hypothetical protein
MSIVNVALECRHSQAHTQAHTPTHGKESDELHDVP